jgi:hypothetical protein
MSLGPRLRAALVRRIRGPYLALGRIDARLADAQRRLEAVEEAALQSLATTHATHQLLSGEMRAVLKAIVAEESQNRRRLHELRARADYAEAWTAARPLVSITIATRERPELLRTRSLPSILGQSHDAIEVIVVGDHEADGTEEVILELGDPRVRYSNLSNRVHISDDPRRRWMVAATMARNEAVRLASGSWIVQFDDDDAMRPDCIERLLARARSDRLEAVYARVLLTPADGGTSFELGRFPPAEGAFTWAAGMYHAGLRFFGRELVAADLGLPGDWYLAERMLRAGVRFGMLDEVLADMYASPMNRPSP